MSKWLWLRNPKSPEENHRRFNVSFWYNRIATLTGQSVFSSGSAHPAMAFARSHLRTNVLNISQPLLCQVGYGIGVIFQLYCSAYLLGDCIQCTNQWIQALLKPRQHHTIATNHDASLDHFGINGTCTLNLFTHKRWNPKFLHTVLYKTIYIHVT